MKTIDVLLRRVLIDGTPTGDARLVVTSDGRAALISRPAGTFVALASSSSATAEQVSGVTQITTTDGHVWTGQKDTRCGSCGGRYELRAIDPAEFLPAVPVADTATFSDTY